MKSWVIAQAVQIVAPVVVGFLSPIIMRAVKEVFAKIALLPADVQRVIVLLIAGVGNTLASFLGVAVTGDPSTWDATTLNTVISSAIAYAVHASSRAKATERDLAALKADGLRALDRGENPFHIPPTR